MLAIVVVVFHVLVCNCCCLYRSALGFVARTACCVGWAVRCVLAIVVVIFHAHVRSVRCVLAVVVVAFAVYACRCCCLRCVCL